MSNIDIIRAWKDEDYRNSLSEEQRSQLPENPAGMIDLSNEDMEVLQGGAKPVPLPQSYTCGCPIFGCGCKKKKNEPTANRLMAS